MDAGHIGGNDHGQRQRSVPMNLDKGYVTINRYVEGRRRHRPESPDAGSADHRQCRMSKRTATASRFSGGRSSTPRSGPTIPAARPGTSSCPTASGWTTEFRADLLNGVQVIKGRSRSDWLRREGHVIKTEQDSRGNPLCDLGEPRSRTRWMCGSRGPRPLPARRLSRLSRRPASDRVAAAAGPRQERASDHRR